MAKKNINLIKLLEKHTYKFPGVTPTKKKKQKPQTPETKVKQKVKKIKKKISRQDDESQRKSVLEEISPEDKAVIADTIRSFFVKFGDPEFEKVVLQTEDASCSLSVDFIYNDILSKFTLPQLIAQLNPIKIPELPIPSLPSFPEISLPSIPEVSFDFPDSLPIVDVTNDVSTKSLDNIKFTIGSTLGCIITNILQSVKKSVQDASKADSKIGSSPIVPLMDEEQILAMTNFVNSLPNVSLVPEDIKLLLEILTSNASPSELIQIFEGQGDLDIVEILGREILEYFPILGPVLESV